MYDVDEQSGIPKYKQTSKTYEPDSLQYTWKFVNKLNETELKIKKVDAADRSYPLSGAEFELYRKDTSGYYQLVTDGTIEHVGNDGKFIVNEYVKLTGITDGVYMIKETQAPSGFIRTNTEIEFTVANGEIGNPQVDGNMIVYTPASGDDAAELEIGNTAGVELPATGGSGTLAYTIAGLAMVMLAGVILVSRKRKKE